MTDTKEQDNPFARTLLMLNDWHEKQQAQAQVSCPRVTKKVDNVDNIA